MADRVPTPADISPAWVTSLLTAQGFNVQIIGVTSVPIGTGQVGATYRFTLDYRGDADGAPHTIVGKFPSNDPLSRQTGKDQLTYLREARFYHNFAGKRPLPVPEPLFLAFDEASHDFVLIMRDLPRHSAGNQLSVPSLHEAALAVGAAAQIHAAWWNDPMLDTLDWPHGSHANTPDFDRDTLYTLFWPAFCERYGARVTPAMRTVGDAYLGKISAWANAITGPRCLTHNDFRPDNMLFDQHDAAQPIVVVDWQTLGVGSGAGDIAYFMGTALDSITRKSDEQSLFELYLAKLIAYGVPKADTGGLWDNYCLAAFSGFLMGATAAMVVGRTERGDAMFLTMCERSAAMVLDHGVAV